MNSKPPTKGGPIEGDKVMSRRHFGYLAVGLAALLASLDPLGISSVWASSAIWAPSQVAKHAASPQADIFLPAAANTIPVGKPGGPTFDKSGAGATEIAALRTRTSETFVSRAGYQLISYPGSIHFKDSSGRWQNIDNTLIKTHAAGYAYQSKANSYTVYLPADLSQAPVDFTLGDASVAFSLVGARGSVQTSGNNATYAGALPNGSVAYSALNDQVKETLTLVDPSQHTFAYTLQISTGLTPKLGASGAIDFNDRSGRTLFGFAPPFMIDAAGVRSSAIQVQLTGAGSSRTLTMTADPAWLSDPTRQFPVVIDPTVTISYSGSSIVKTYTGANQDCYIVSSSPTTSFCGGTSLYAGHTGSSTDRSLLQFNVSIPQDANILEADLAAEVTHAASSSATSVSLYPVTTAWTTSASWNKRDSTNSWTNPGGDFSSSPAWTNTSVGPSSGWYHWYLSSVVQGWVNGGAINNGLILKADNETTTDQLTFNSSEATHSADWPYLKVIYQLGIGDLAWYQNDSQTLTDHLQLKENLSSGNLLAIQNLVTITGTGLSERFNLNYNILSPNLWDFGRAWITNTGWDQYIDPNMGDGASFFGPTGYAFHYIKNSNGTYTTPPGIDADLVQNGDGSWTVTYHSSGEKLNFTSNGLYMTSDVDRNGDAIRFAYDGNGALASITDTQGRVTTFAYVYGTYSGCAPPTASGFVKKITDPAGRTYQFMYDANCDLTTYTDPNNKVTTYGYDSLFNLIKITDPIGNQTKLTYSSIYKVTSVTQVTNVSQGTGPTTSFTYNTGNTVVTDPDNNQSTFVYDTRDRVTQATNPSGSTYTTYTGDNKHATDKDQDGNQSTYSYNSSNDLTTMTPPVSRQGQSAAATTFSFQTPSSVSEYQYLPSSVTDPQGNCTAFVYDSAGNQTDAYQGQATNCDGLTGGVHVSLRYQGDNGTNCGAKTGEICSSTDALGNLKTYSYDTNGNLTRVTPPSPLGAPTIAVDSLSRVVSVTDGRGQKTAYAYDAFDRVTQILYNGATTCTPATGNCITYAYDADGNRTTMIDNTGTTTYYYDRLNRPTTTSLPNTPSACAGSSPSGITSTYDAAGNLLTYCDGGGTTTYGYDSSYNLVSLAEPGGSCGSTPSLCTTFGYDQNGNRTLTTYPGGATLNAAYGTSGNLISLVGKDKNGAVITSFTYTFNNGTKDTQLKQTATEADSVANNTYSYSYDALNELKQATVTAGTGISYGYTYDANGNMTTKSAGAATTTMAYNAANELCWLYVGTSSNSCSSSPSGSTTFTFDANGNETGNSGGSSFSYNAKNQTTAITFGGTTLSPLTYSGSDQTQRTAVGATILDNGQSGVAISTTSGISTYYLRDTNGQLVGERIGGSHYYYLFDGLGSVVSVISGDGLTVSNRYGYDPYGNVTYRSGSIANPWGYASGYTDSTGLLKFGARYYDPSSARWTQMDPAGQGFNAYRYTNSNPVNGTDPSGAWCCLGWNGVHWYWWGIAGAIWFWLSRDDVQKILWFWPPWAGVIGGVVGAALGGLLGLPVFGIGAVPGAIIGAAIGGILGYALGTVLTWPLYYGSGYGEHGVWVTVWWWHYWWGSNGAAYSVS
jgi:RHS repeat-associated protein